MGKAIKNQIQGMSWWARLSLVALLTLATTVFMYEGWYKPKPAQAAISTVSGNAWSEIYSNQAAGRPGTIAYTVNAGSGTSRLLVVAVSTETATAAAETLSITYGTRSMTSVRADGGTTQGHSYLFVLKESELDLAINSNLVFTFGGANAALTAVYATVFDGVDQTTPISGNSGNTGTTSVALTTAIVPITGETTVEVVSMGRASSGTARTISTPAANWSISLTGTALTDATRMLNPYILTNTTAGSTTAAHTISSTTASTHSMSAMRINPQTTTTPTLTTPTATIITATTATLGATVTADGGSVATERGVVWATTTAPTTSNNKVTGTGTTGAYTVSASSLPAGTRIYYRGYAINGIGTAYSPEGSFYTEPSSQANTVTFSNVTQTGMTVGWNRGNGAGVIVVMKSGSAVDTAPADGNDGYTAAAGFGTGTQIGTGNYVVYKGNGSAVTVTGLTNSTTYHVAVYEYSGSGNNAAPALGINYLLTPATGNRATLSPCAAGTPTGLTVGTETTSSVPLTWTAGAATNYYIVYRNGSQIATNVFTPSFTDNSVTPGAAYTYSVSGYNTPGTCSSAQTSAANAYVIPLVPSIPVTANPGTGTTLQVTIGTDTNDSSVLYAIRVNTTQYVQSTGALGGTAFWQSKSNWGTKTVTGLTANTDYTFAVAARNINPTPDTTAYGSSKLQRTTVLMPTTITGCNGCHENPPTDTGITSRAGGEFAGSHSKHAVTLGQACTVCHVNNGTSFNHSNGLIQMAGSGASYTKGTSFAINNAATMTGGTCSSLYCHSNGTGGTSQLGEVRPLQALPTPNWGATTNCGSCHGNPPSYANYTRATIVSGSKANAHQGTAHAASACTVCHDTTTGKHGDGFYSIQASLGYTYNSRRGGTCATAGCHGSVNWGGKLGCVACHAQSYTRTKGAIGATLSAIKSEFGLAWGHKNSGRLAVTDEDCIVCHLEGVSTTKKPSTTYHQNGTIDLRNPDATTGETPITNIAGTAWTFRRFSTSFASGSRTSSATTETIANIISQQFCLKCHDANGALGTAARTSVGSQYMPWGGTQGANYTVANGAAALNGLVNVAGQFATTNRSDHPVLGPRNSDFPTAARLADPYKPTGTRGTQGTKSTSIVMNCFDCHNVPGASPRTTRTVSAHGNAATLRGVVTVSGTPSATNETTLCNVCHLLYRSTAQMHGSGSAWASGGNSTHTAYVEFGCNMCHSSGYTTAVPRPIRAADSHGTNTLGAVGTLITATGRWSTDPTPVAFIRNRQIFPNHAPRALTVAPTYTATSGSCMGGNASPCSRGTETYTTGGSY